VFGDVEEVAFAGWKIRMRLASAVATATVEQAQTDGLVSGDTVPITVVEQIADQSAQAAVRAEEMLDRSSGGRPRSRLGVGQRPPTLPPSLLERLARDAVDASSEGARET
jgi:hypothetical protein